MAPFVRWLVTRLISHWAAYELESFDGVQSTDGAEWASASKVIKLMVRFLFQSDNNEDDVWICGFSFVNTVSELPGAEPDSNMLSTAEAAFDTYWAAIKSNYSTQLSLVEYRWYAHPFDGSPAGAPIRATAKSVAGTQAASSYAVPAEACLTVTLVTPVRKHWGRAYLPMPQGCGSTTAMKYGQIQTATLTTYANGMRTFLNACHAVGLTPCIFSKSRESVLSISEVHVDSTPDHQRRRRPRRPSDIIKLTTAS